MPFKDYSPTPSNNIAIGDGLFIGPNMDRNNVRPALQQIAADGKELDATVRSIAEIGVNTDPLVRPDLASPSPGKGSALVAFKQAGAGAVPRTMEDKARDTISVADFGAVGDGVADDSTPLLQAALGSQSGLTDGLRILAGVVHLPPGRFRVTGPLDLSTVGGVSGLIIAGSGGTEILFDGPEATLKCTSGRTITFRDVVFRSTESTEVNPGDPYGVDLAQTAFTIAQTGNPLRSWRFERCNFYFFKTCFTVSGTSMCSEFYFDKCIFGNCYTLMDNSNNQAVNWNFVNCDWENAELDTTLPKGKASAFKLNQGMSFVWTGGSLIFYGSLIYHTPTNSSAYEGNSHRQTFQGVRIERVSNGGTVEPLFDRPEDGSYIVAGNSPSISLINATQLLRDGVAFNPIEFKLWDNLKLVIENCEFEEGRVVGVYGPLSAANTGQLVVKNTSGLTYSENVSGRVSDHIAHSVDMEPDRRGDTLAVTFQQRSRSLAVPVSLPIQTLTVCGPTGSLPQGGTTINLPVFNPHAVLLRLFLRKFAPSAQSLTVQLRDQADTTTYATLTTAPTDRVAYGEINLEVGFQVTSPLMLKFVGTAEVVKGLVGVEYL